VILGHNGWSVFRFGPSYGLPNPGVQFPLQAVDEWLKQLVPDFSFYLRGTPSTVSYPALNADVETLLKKIDRVVYIGHSQGGAEIVTIVEAISDPNLFAGLISAEGGRCPPVADALCTRTSPSLM
jgi:pimeloyl-ACP methyl ester carboxylesterase